MFSLPFILVFCFLSLMLLTTLVSCLFILIVLLGRRDSKPRRGEEEEEEARLTHYPSHPEPKVPKDVSSCYLRGGCYRKQRQGGGEIQVPPPDSAVLEILCISSRIWERSLRNGASAQGLKG
ncbi:hypothetical protein HJG60_008076 [Phyllostomus discolor]|uniref:Uncharacterized protein n=1 Tax=Phyllostomus discolor TaxID=89673 RepID=A0A834BNY2_9CHIR|nr:hypothetical protein HJG60_008076 [Phyllostomus discolor]